MSIDPQVEEWLKQYQASVKTSYEVLLELTEGHVAEFYGPYGCGKSRLMQQIAVEAQNVGKKVLYIDSEMGLCEEHIKQLKHYWYIGDELEAMEEAVAWAKDHRNEFDMLVVDSLGHAVYTSYVQLGKLDEKLKAFQRLATVFRDMVRFARGERGKDYNPENPLESKRKALALAVCHPVSEFTRIAKGLTEDEPLMPFGGAIHRIPKVILRVEPLLMDERKSVFNILSYKLRDMPKNVVVGRYTITDEGVAVEWKI